MDGFTPKRKIVCVSRVGVSHLMERSKVEKVDVCICEMTYKLGENALSF